MSVSLEQLTAWMTSKESEHLEFKEAKNTYNQEKLRQYAAALANERGGKVILGVTDKQPRRVVGTHFAAQDQVKSAILNKLHLRVDFDEVAHPDGRVLVMHVPSRPIGEPVALDGTYLMRSGEELVPMPPSMLQSIFAEATPDFSADVCSKAEFSDLNVNAIENFRERWLRKLRDSTAPTAHDHALRLAQASVQEVLNSAELLLDGDLTYAALILFGTRQALGRYLAQSEIVFEYRSNEASGPAADREEYREGFFAFYDLLWNRINLRNDRQPFQERLFVLDIPTFNERATREAILNAVSHRDYRHAGNTFIRQYSRRISFVSPGGFPPGINLKNILDKQLPRNRRIAEVFERCGLVERSGQGVNLMFEQCIKESKPRPDFTGTDDHQVSLILRGEVQDIRFLQFLEKVGTDRVAQLSTQDLLILDYIHTERRIPAELRNRLLLLVDAGIVESVGHRRYTLSRRFYTFVGQKGTYTRKRGLDHETNKALLERHITENNAEGSRLKELAQVLPNLSLRQVQNLLNELRSEDRVHLVGSRNKAQWYAGATEIVKLPIVN